MSLGPITWDDQAKLVALVNVAHRITDLGVVPVRVWKLIAHCLRHGQVSDEVTVSLTEQPPGTLNCALCKVALLRYDESATKIATAALLRG